MEQLAKNSSYSEDSVIIKMIRKAGGSMSVIAQELVFEAKKKVAEQNFDLAYYINQNYYRCLDKGKETKQFFLNINTDG